MTAVLTEEDVIRWTGASRADSEGARSEPRENAGDGPRPETYPFDADMHACELDERGRLGPTWAARGRRLGRSTLAIRSRRMTFPGRRLLVGVHRIDSEPVALCGVVRTCEYDGGGQYLLDMDLMVVPEGLHIGTWLRTLRRPA